jgi:hypothetical protein
VIGEWRLVTAIGAAMAKPAEPGREEDGDERCKGTTDQRADHETDVARGVAQDGAEDGAESGEKPGDEEDGERAHRKGERGRERAREGERRRESRDRCYFRRSTRIASGASLPAGPSRGATVEPDPC